ncbi:MAG: nicotinamide mononucleotide transporter [Bacteroidaceae bacterium]|nr:nicotinamide mononucleotide transporter [Bacteroidaceae bacterium]MBR1377735.1 nicotinamide mononucleotide transporter [Bacteroidaceae bacterium]
MLEYITTHPLDTLGTILGFIYLILEFRTSVWMWVVGSIMPAIYIVVLYKAGIYADCGMEVYYFLAGIYGLIIWLRGKTETGTIVSISHTPRKLWPRLSLLFIILFVAIAAFLRECTDSRVPYIDSFTTTLSIIAMWMLSRKYIEQWWVWLVVDAASSGLYIYKGIYGRSILYAIYTIMAIYGWYTWQKKLKQQEA